MGKVDTQITTLLKDSEEPLSLAEIADQIGKPQKTVFKSLRKLFSGAKIACDGQTRKYSLVQE
jgi:DNA-binding IclR family transcriptional regulator